MSSDQIRELLVEEAGSGTTKLDTLPDCATMPLSGEAEAMYFKSVRDFFKTNYFKLIFQKGIDKFI